MHGQVGLGPLPLSLGCEAEEESAEGLIEVQKITGIKTELHLSFQHFWGSETKK